MGANREPDFKIPKGYKTADERWAGTPVEPITPELSAASSLLALEVDLEMQSPSVETLEHLKTRLQQIIEADE